MSSGPAADLLARLDDVEVCELAGSDQVDAVLALLDRAEADGGVPLVDESERVRLEDLASGRALRASDWHSALATRDGHPVGYGALVVAGPTDQATGDVAVDRRSAQPRTTLEALLAACTALGRRHTAGRLQVWLRDADEDELRLATTAGYRVDRRLGILERTLADLPTAQPPSTVTIDRFREADADAVVEVLAAAYAGTDDAGWTRDDLDARRSLDWFDPADLLVARDVDGSMVGIHWTKQRGEGIGEVHNLAVHPDARGRHLGGVLLAAGLAHLQEVGCERVLLWVDLANERAVDLYTSQGFEVAWVDVALGREPDRGLR